MAVHGMYVSDYTVVDIMTVGNADFYVVLDSCPGFEFL
jgi:glycosidase